MKLIKKMYHNNDPMPASEKLEFKRIYDNNTFDILAVIFYGLIITGAVIFVMVQLVINY